jgi:hypothetical protein
MGVRSHRPHVTLIELPIGSKSKTRIAAAICYDATDLDLVADLRDRSDMFLVAALNQDVQTFDNMIAALHFHMYQPVALANSGEFGGSTCAGATAQARTTGRACAWEQPGRRQRLEVDLRCSKR